MRRRKSRPPSGSLGLKGSKTHLTKKIEEKEREVGTVWAEFRDPSDLDGVIDLRN